MRRPQDDISKLFQESLDSYQPEVPKDLWAGIQNQLPQTSASGVEVGASSANAGTSLFTKLMVSALAVAGSVVGVVYLNSDSVDPNNETVEVLSEKQEFSEVESMNSNSENQEEVKSSIESDDAQNGTQNLSNSEQVPSEISDLSVNDLSSLNKSEGDSERNSDDLANENLASHQIASESDKKEVNSGVSDGKNLAPESKSVSQQDTHERKVDMILSNEEGTTPFSIDLSTNCAVANCLFEIRTPNGDVIKARTADTNLILESIGTYQISMVSQSETGQLFTQTKYVKVHPVEEEKPNEKEPLFTSLPENIEESFSPNGDGIRDYFSIPTESIEVSSFEWTVFDRSGRTIYKTVNPNDTWNGKYNNQDVPSGTYFYMVTVKDVDGKVYMNRGNVLLIR